MAPGIRADAGTWCAITEGESSAVVQQKVPQKCQQKNEGLNPRGKKRALSREEHGLGRQQRGERAGRSARLTGTLRPRRHRGPSGKREGSAREGLPETEMARTPVRIPSSRFSLLASLEEQRLEKMNPIDSPTWLRSFLLSACQSRRWPGRRSDGRYDEGRGGECRRQLGEAERGVAHTAAHTEIPHQCAIKKENQRGE